MLSAMEVWVLYLCTAGVIVRSESDDYERHSEERVPLGLPLPMLPVLLTNGEQTEAPVVLFHDDEDLASTPSHTFEFGTENGEVIFTKQGEIGFAAEDYVTVIPYDLPACSQMSHIRISVTNPHGTPSIAVDALKQTITIRYRYNQNSQSSYDIEVKAVSNPNCTTANDEPEQQMGEDDDSSRKLSEMAIGLEKPGDDSIDGLPSRRKKRAILHKAIADSAAMKPIGVAFLREFIP